MSRQKLKLPGKAGAYVSTVLRHDFANSLYRLLPRPIALQLACESDPREGNRTGLLHALHGPFVRFRADTTWG